MVEMSEIQSKDVKLGRTYRAFFGETDIAGAPNGTACPHNRLLVNPTNHNPPGKPNSRASGRKPRPTLAD